MKPEYQRPPQNFGLLRLLPLTDLQGPISMASWEDILAMSHLQTRGITMF